MIKALRPIYDFAAYFPITLNAARARDFLERSTGELLLKHRFSDKSHDCEVFLKDQPLSLGEGIDLVGDKLSEQYARDLIAIIEISSALFLLDHAKWNDKEWNIDTTSLSLGALPRVLAENIAITIPINMEDTERRFQKLWTDPLTLTSKQALKIIEEARAMYHDLIAGNDFTPEERQALLDIIWEDTAQEVFSELGRSTGPQPDDDL